MFASLLSFVLPQADQPWNNKQILLISLTTLFQVVSSKIDYSLFASIFSHFLEFSPFFLSFCLYNRCLPLSAVHWLTSAVVFASPFPDLQLPGMHAQNIHTHCKARLLMASIFLDSVSRELQSLYSRKKSDRDRTFNIHANNAKPEEIFSLSLHTENFTFLQSLPNSTADRYVLIICHYICWLWVLCHIIPSGG